MPNVLRYILPNKLCNIYRLSNRLGHVATILIKHLLEFNFSAAHVCGEHSTSIQFNRCIIDRQGLFAKRPHVTRGGRIVFDGKS